MIDTRNNLVVYMDSILGNPLQQRFVVRWVLYFEMWEPMRSWDENDLILWYTDIYQRFTSTVQSYNGYCVDDSYKPNRSSIMHIIGNIESILQYFPSSVLSTKEDDSICYTIRKLGYSISRQNGSRNLSAFSCLDHRSCIHCQREKWPSICSCQGYVDGIRLIHDSTKQKTYRFETISLQEKIEIFKKCKLFYQYDPFCFSAVFASLYNCITCIPPVEVFKDTSIDLFENTPWMQCGIYYGSPDNTEKREMAEESITFTSCVLHNLFYKINETNVRHATQCMFNHFFAKTSLPPKISYPKMKVLFYTNCQGSNVMTVLTKVTSVERFFEITYINNFIDDKTIDFYNSIPTYDIIIYQPVRDEHINASKKFLPLVSKHTKLISFPYLYCNWLWPFGIELKDTLSLLPITPFVNGELLNQTNFHLKDRMLRSLSILEEKEKNTDIKVVNFIRENYKRRRLFFTKNHVTRPVLIHLGNEILRHLNITYTIEEQKYTDLGVYNKYWIQPICSIVQRELDLEYVDEDGDTFFINYARDILVHRLEWERLHEKYILSDNFSIYSPDFFV
ncbi:hypothetical protein EBS02_05845 [bacterium]|nr:hypothetical protein [bacterium]